VTDFGVVPYVTAAVQVIPVLVIAAVLDALDRRDAADPVHRIYASSALAVGLAFGVVGEIAGLQALLTGPGDQSLALVSGGLAALAATVILPQFAEFNFVKSPDAARRFTQRLLPTMIGGVGVVMSSLSAPLPARVILYAGVAFSFLLRLVSAIADLRRPTPPESRAGAGRDQESQTKPASVMHQHPVEARRPTTNNDRSGLALLVSGIALGLALNRRKRGRTST